MSEHDFLSEMLRSVRLSGAIFFEVDAAAPWVAAAPPKESIAPAVVSDARHVIEYHVIVEGTCWTRLISPGGPPIQLGPEASSSSRTAIPMSLPATRTSMRNRASPPSTRSRAGARSPSTSISGRRCRRGAVALRFPRLRCGAVQSADRRAAARDSRAGRLPLSAEPRSDLLG